MVVSNKTNKISTNIFNMENKKIFKIAAAIILPLVFLGFWRPSTASAFFISDQCPPPVPAGDICQNYSIEDLFTSDGVGGYTWAELNKLIGPYINTISPTGAAYTQAQVAQKTGLPLQVVSTYVTKSQESGAAVVSGALDWCTSTFITTYNSGKAFGYSSVDACETACGSGQYPTCSTGGTTPTTPTVPTTPTTPPTSSGGGWSSGGGSVLEQELAYAQTMVNLINSTIQNNRRALESIGATGNNVNIRGNTSTGATGGSPVTVNADVLNVRLAPSTRTSVMGQLRANDNVTAVCYVVGESVEGSSKWWKLSDGNYVWAGGTAGQLSNSSLCSAGSTGGSGTQPVGTGAPTPVFYVGPYKTTSNLCGSPFTFLVENYSGTQIWLEQTKNAMPNYSGVFTVPYNNLGTCDWGEGYYGNNVYTVVDGHKGVFLGSAPFTIFYPPAK